MNRSLHSPLGILVTTLFVPFTARAQPPRQPHGGELARAVERLAVVGNVLYVAAHPDDENTRLLAWLANDRLIRTAYLSITRGDGGQNLIGGEQGPLLGLIRTQELLAARRVDGAEQMFTRARDFGFSKTPDETLSIWGKDEVLSDVVHAIRRFKPDVIVTRFPTKGLETHGHHTASAILAEAAFKLAADASYHPEEVKELGTWQAKRLLWNKSSFFLKPGEDVSAFLKTDIGGFNPSLGVSYGEMAADSRSMHKSQGFGAARSRGPSLEYFQPTLGDAPKQSFLEGVDWSWRRVAGTEKLIPLLEKARAEFNAEKPASIIPTLLLALSEIEHLPDNPWKEPKRHELVEVIAACAGLFAEANAADFSTVPGAQLAITGTVINRSAAAISLKEIHFSDGTSVTVDKALPNDEPIEVVKNLTIPADLPFSNPYWLAVAPSKGLYTVPDPRLIGVPENPPALYAEFVFTMGDKRFTLPRPIGFKWTDPVAGERWRSIEVTPPVMVNPSATVLMFPDGKSKELKVSLKAGAANSEGAVKLEAPSGWKVSPESLPFKLVNKGDEGELAFQVTPAERSGDAALKVIVNIGGHTSSRGVTRIDHSHIPIQTLFPEAEVKLVRFDLKRGKSKVGYIPGPGDDVAAALRQVGYDVTILSDEALRTEALAKYDAIVVGVRAYNTNARLPFHHQKLMDYVKAGGTLVAQYSTSNRISKAPTQIGPLPFDISQERVTDENAKVNFLAPAHVLLSSPNKITAADFEGWVQERGLYFAGKWDDKYESILGMNDPGEPLRKGSLLFLKFGKGAFIYTGLAFFRQLSAGVPGAYRLFSNLLAAHGK